MLERSIRCLLPFCARVFVVTGAHEAAISIILRGIEGVTPVYNPDFALGMYSSVKAGLRQTAAGDVFLLPGDCPFAAPESCAALLAAKGEIVVPVWRGRAGHPVLLRRAAIREIVCDSAHESLRAFIAARHPTPVAVSCDGILRDIDTEEDWRQAWDCLPAK